MPGEATPVKPIGAPVGAHPHQAQRKLTATWSAPTDSGTDASPATRSASPSWASGDQLCATAATAFTCTGVAPAGAGCEVNVTAIDTAGNRGHPLDGGPSPSPPPFRFPSGR